MQYQTFRGADVQGALFNVREALGADALIESTHVHAGPAESALGRELAQLRRMRDELSQGRPPRGVKGNGRELRSWLRESVGQKLTCRSGLVEAPGRRLIACVGPSGVGKTTTLAKLAARATFSCKRRVRVISLDNFRVGAVEQWRRYAELIGVPFDIAPNADAFHRVVHDNPDELFLVDTAGRAGDHKASLPACLKGLRNLQSEVLLVLPAWLRARDAERALEQYAEPEPSGIVITKLDETDQVGGVMHAPLGSNLPLTYLCDGARVPEDIHDAAIDRVLDAIFPEQA